ncbi:hypothetical protein EI77_00936 [Prosthecobacter fusiformis]|uniref:Nucleic acid-binding protein n=1 Tax=Prosthecobacter fusiformis TaxID=48464 RepID=A0A4R7ST14_9BACT|nr:DUF3368 domain-containing protein [Prosthecobacter fusiformis]TDU81626.1 hypothetical protein EI77_00936 [Prosthecobacter fusiformis]
MIVVADTSVILNLCQVGLHPLLKELFEVVYAPIEVAEEFDRITAAYPLFGGVTFPQWIQVLQTSHSLENRAPWAQLDRGESAAIELALEHQADAVLLDEQQGRKVAEALGLEVVGILGVLFRAKQASHLKLLRPVLDDLQNRSRFWLSARTREKILQLADET